MEQHKENKMGVMPVNKLLISMSLPMMVSMLVQAMYNIVDSIFVAQLSENALTAVSLAFPMQSLMIASATGTGVGVNALLSRSLGQKDYKTVNKAASNGIFLWACWYVVFLIIGLTLVRPFYNLQSSPADITELGVEYLSTVLVCSIGVFMQMSFERLLQATGRTVCTMITQMTGAVINIIMDPILIFGLLGFPALGIRGAAIATVFGQIVAGVMAIIMNIKLNHDVHISFRGFRPNGKIIGTILSIGIPSLLMQAVGSVMTVGMNKILIAFSSTAVAVFGVYFKLNSFIFMPIFGLNNGMVPIVAYNYGAGHRDRLLKTIKYSVIYAVILMFIGIIIFETIPDKLLLLFNASDNMLAIGVPALRIICLSFTFAGVCIVLGSAFQALGNGIFSMVISFTRQIIILLPSAYLLSLTGNVDNVWWSYNIAEIVSLTATILFFVHMYKKVICKIGK
ncbi:MAG: MATE family efflux transporter [bacterium]|nr:MATE family efflux transporter [bacterium]